jgi:hypothetical protein
MGGKGAFFDHSFFPTFNYSFGLRAVLLHKASLRLQEQTRIIQIPDSDIVQLEPKFKALDVHGAQPQARSGFIRTFLCQHSQSGGSGH